MWWFLLGCIDLSADTDPKESATPEGDTDSDSDSDADSDADGDSDADADADADADSDSDADRDSAGDDEDSGDSGGDEPPPRDPMITVTWTRDGVVLNVTRTSASTFYMGMAETGSSEGWYGEDCIDGPGPNSGSYDICHDSVDVSGGFLETVRSPDDVVANRTTLFNDTIAAAGNITYVFYDGVECWTFGHEPSYYSAALGCSEL